LPAVSLAWGLWEPASGMTGRLGRGQRDRISRGGVAALTAEEGLALLDQAAGQDQALLVAARLDLAGLRGMAASGQQVPPLLHALAGPPARPAAAAAAGASALRDQLSALPDAGQVQLLTRLVQAEAAAVLGHASPEAIEPGRAFKDLGFDSLTAVELRNRLAAATGLRLPATLVFDHPVPLVLADYLRGQIVPEETNVLPPIFSELDQLESSLADISSNYDMHEDITRRIQVILSKWISSQSKTGADDSSIELQSATPDEVLDFFDKELGSFD
jgi:hypothetical protein